MLKKCDAEELLGGGGGEKEGNNGLKNSVRLQPSYLSFWLNKHRNFLVE
jgi:hypothetical protein